MIPRAFAAATTLFLIAAYGSSPVVRPDGAVWILESMYDKPPIENTFLTLEVNANSFSGSAGCNRYGGRSEGGTSIAGGGGAFSTPPIVSTVMDCPPAAIIDQESAYLRALGNAKRFRVIGDRLEILDTAGDAILLFVKQKTLSGTPIALAGTQWQLLTEGDWEGDAPAATLVFLDDYRAAGVAPCLDYLATYEASEGRIGFSRMLMVGDYSFCAEEFLKLEGGFTNVLSQARDYSVDKDAGSSRLLIRTSRGKMLTFEPTLPAVHNITDVDWALKAFVKDHVPEPGTRKMLVTEPLPGPEVTMSFGEGRVSGSAGCNSYEARYGVDDQEITFDSLLATDRACANPAGVMEREARFLNILPSLTKLHIYGDRLFIHGKDGRAMLFVLTPAE